MEEMYIYDYTELLEQILSIAYEKKFSLPALEKRLSYSSFFQKIEKSFKNLPPTISLEDLVKDIYYELNIDIDKIKTYSQCMWVAESYIRIQYKFKLTFECIFIILPIERMYELFDIYHEMDFSQIIDYFDNLYHNDIVLNIVLNRTKISIPTLSKYTNIPINTLYSLKTKRRDIQKLDVISALKISQFLKIRCETLVEAKQ